jgi:acyl-CoA thioester hydrolase
MNQLQLKDFPVRSFDKLRYADTDRQGHVNNAVFATFLETGRVEFLYDNEFPVFSRGASFVIASLELNFLKEMNWPGQVDIGTGVLKVGNSSIQLYQQLFQNDQCVATSESVIVQVDDQTGRSKPLEEKAKKMLGRWLVKIR